VVFKQFAFMNSTDIAGSLGVGLILLAYFLNTARLLDHHRKGFYVMNIIGAALACYASWLLRYSPFVILEATWTVVSIYGLMKAMKIKMT
jgi:hypothetical protein